MARTQIGDADMGRPAMAGGPAQAAQPFQGLSWGGIVRLGFVQMALGAIVILTTSTLNRVMIVELGLAALVPGTLIGWHYAIQILRPRFGYGSDRGGRHVPWIIGGIGTLGIGGILGAVSVVLMAAHFATGLAVAVLAFLLIGIGVGAGGTTLLVLLSKRVAPERRAAAATIVWTMMILGFIITAKTAGDLLEPYSPMRLVFVMAGVCAIAFVVTCAAVIGMELPRTDAGQSAGADAAVDPDAQRDDQPTFREALSQVWAERDARQFTIFVFVAMLAYATQDLILEPFAGIAFGMTPGETTKLAGVQNQGVLIGMLSVAGIATVYAGTWLGSLKMWTVGGCVASGMVLFALAFGGSVAPDWPLTATIFALGLANGAFAVAAIGSMMALAGAGRGQRDGTRMGLWGAAQGMAFCLSAFLGAGSVDAVTAAMGTPITAYIAAFILEGCLFLIAAGLALQIGRDHAARERLAAGPRLTAVGESLLPASEGRRA